MRSPRYGDLKALCIQLPGLENLSEPQDDEGCAVLQFRAAGIQVSRHCRQPLVLHTGSYSACRQRSERLFAHRLHEAPIGWADLPGKPSMVD